jgi:hypothetical protein
VEDGSPEDVPPDPPRYIAVVRPGHAEIYEFLRHFQAANYAELVWDRRVGERRQPSGTVTPDRRTGERRVIAPPTWNALGFVLSPRDAAEDDAVENGTRPEPGRANLCVVRRGHPDVFEILTEHFREDPSVHVIWDRREGHRRTRSEPVPLERRQANRRLAP